MLNHSWKGQTMEKHGQHIQPWKTCFSMFVVNHNLTISVIFNHVKKWSNNLKHAQTWSPHLTMVNLVQYRSM